MVILAENGMCKFAHYQFQKSNKINSLSMSDLKGAFWNKPENFW